MDILNGTNTRGPIRLSFTPDEFDYLCSALQAGDEPASTNDDDVCGAILRFQATFTDPCPHTAGHHGPWEIGCSLPALHPGPHNEDRHTDLRETT